MTIRSGGIPSSSNTRRIASETVTYRSAPCRYLTRFGAGNERPPVENSTRRETTTPGRRALPMNAAATAPSVCA